MEISEIEWGLAGYGKSGSVELQLDEPANDHSPYALQIWIDVIRINLKIENERKAEELKAYIKSTLNNQEYDDQELPDGSFRRREVPSITIGSLGNTKIKLIRDGEFGDRYFINGYDQGTSSSISITLGGQLLDDFISALDDLIEDLNQ